MKDFIVSTVNTLMVFSCGILVGLMISAPAKVILSPADNRMVVDKWIYLDQVLGPQVIPVECCGMLTPDINTQVELEYQQLLRDEDAALNHSFNSALGQSKDIYKWALPGMPCSR